ncbi:MAG TPA: SprB repeat-containing protein [Ohtaekwangia sp.]|uniref:SprB repeat-containing protein n=1 Tax=Ohtaekwangia sp. TaxID=2066019 RepID=UPI002F924552
MRNLFLFFALGLFAGACVSHDLNRTIDCSISGLSLEVNSITAATSCSTLDGSIHVTATGGKQPYTFWLNDVKQTSHIFTALQAGIYSIQVIDANGCDAAVHNIMIGATDFTFSLDVEEDNLCLGSNGSATITVTEGNPPYTYTIDGSEFTDNNTFTNLETGNHAVQVKDNNGCTIALNITIPRGTTDVSWTNDIRPIIVTSCAITGCHNGISRQDLRIYEKAKYYASQIKMFTRDRSMPFEGSLTQNQIDIISCWVDDGAPNN